jgi:hypothetical protein
MVALESLADTLGLSIDRIDYFQTLRDLRNKDLYTGGTYISDSQAAEAVEEVRKLAEDLAGWLTQQDKGE